MRILLNFGRFKGLHIHTLAEDARTVIGPFIEVESTAALVRLLRYVGAGEAEIAHFESCYQRWGQGSVWIELAQGRKNLLRLRGKWAEWVTGMDAWLKYVEPYGPAFMVVTGFMMYLLGLCHGIKTRKSRGAR